MDIIGGQKQSARTAQYPATMAHRVIELLLPLLTTPADVGEALLTRERATQLAKVGAPPSTFVEE